MDDPRIGALLALGRGRMASVDVPGWADVVAAMSPTGQRPFVLDSRQGAIARKGRGAGGSFAQAAKFHRPSAAHPGCSSVFVTISAERSRDILLPAIWKMNDEHGWGVHYREKDRACVWPNEYRVLLRGCGDRLECDKRRGTPWVAAGWDECASINPTLLEYDIHECVEPRLADYNGLWWASGTPGPVEIGYWHKLSSGAAGYPVHEWDASTNPHIPNLLDYWFGVLQRMQGVPRRETWPPGCQSLMDIIANPKHWHLLPARFVREYLGKWVQDLTALVYRLTARNSYQTLPITPNFVTIGCDLGSYNEEDPELKKLDKAAITVACSHSSLPNIWIPESRKLREVDLDILHNELVKTLERYPDGVVHVDSGSAGKLVEITFKKWGIPIVAAAKGPKLRRIQLVQAAIANGNFQVQQESCMDLRSESTRLVFNDERTDHSPVCEDDAWDSALMAAVPHFGDHEPPPPKEPEPGTPEWQAKQELLEFERALEEAQGQAARR